MKTEIWKNIKGYDNKYQISSYGNLRRIVQGKSKNLKLYHNYDGYLKKRLSFLKKGIQRNYYVHRLVAETFIPNPYPDRIFVNHKNHIRNDNRIENLEWVSHQMNIDHAHQYSVGDIIDYTIDQVFFILDKKGYKIKRPDEINRLAFQRTLYGVDV